MLIRGFKESDRPFLRNLFLESRRKIFYWFDINLFALQDFDDQTKNENIWVAETETVIIGFISVWTPDNYVHHLFVHPDHIRKGIGKSLLNFCVSNIPKPLTLKCLENNVNALVFYASQG